MDAKILDQVYVIDNIKRTEIQMELLFNRKGHQKKLFILQRKKE